MAEGILTDAVGRILEVLGSRTFKEIQLAYGTQYEINKLKDTVEIINGVLLDAEEQINEKRKNHAVTVWLRRLKDAVYDADDLLDGFYTQLKLKEVMSGNKIAKEHDNGKGVNYYQREREQTYSFVLEENVLGRDDDKKAILELLLDSNDRAENNIPVISIVGVGGIGKTTLVQSIYNVEQVKNHFQLRMWVCVSDDFKLKTVVEKILKSIDTEKEFEKLEMDGLQNKFREQIDGKKYLLVLDDVWNKNPNRWSELKDLLRNRARGSKILVTTREERVANIMSRPSLIYVLKGLNPDKSWYLFTKFAFEQGKEPTDSGLVEIGKDIVAKCVGVPLAIRTLGNLLCRKEKEDWLSFRDNELLELDQQGDIFPILKLSYDHLSSQLKQCFAYCALFPKDYEFEKENLIPLWMAQGFLGTPNKNQCLEDVGNEYFVDLISGSFLQVVKEKNWGYRRVMTCKMHDLMHDVAQSVAGNECKMVTSDANNVDERSLHISFYPNLESLSMSNAMLRANRFRTLFSLYFAFELNNFHFNKIISNFRYLRSLNLSGLKVIKLPTSINKLKHLRYLDLSHNLEIKELPNSISKLINLQTLILSGCIRLKKLPSNMRKMVSLQYLMIDDCESLTNMPCGLEQLRSLRTLPLFVVGKKDRTNVELRKLNGLNNLRGGLTIKVKGKEENVNLSEANLEEKQYLVSITLAGKGAMVESLKLHPNLKELSIINLGSVMFSGCMSSFTNLAKIVISRSSNFRDITPLDQLPSLLSLNLEWLDSVEYLSVSDRVSNNSTSTPPPPPPPFFPSLKELTICYCEKLKGWWKINDDEDDQGKNTGKAQLLSFPCLSKLYILNCSMLTGMPLFPTLEELYLHDTSTKPLLQTLSVKMKNKTIADAEAPSTSYTVFDTAPTALSNIKTLSLTRINDFESLPELLQSINSLVAMDITDSPRLISQLPQCVKYLSSLQQLAIGSCDKLDFLNDDVSDDRQCKWQGLSSLRYLQISRIENMVSLQKWIHRFTTLQCLAIWDCKSLMELPKGMQLEKLEIDGCPHLSERYGNNKSVEWPKIAHIPNIKINFRQIQLEGLPI